MNAADPMPFSRLDRARMLALNNAHAAELSAVDMPAFDRLIARACYSRGFDEPAAFLLAFDETAGDGIGPNYAWFKTRYPRFVYIDRVVVDGAGRGRGLASRLYEDLFAVARKAGQVVVGCEVNIDPPNPVSDAYHARHGFTEVGLAHLADRGKTVRYLMRHLTET